MARRKDGSRRGSRPLRIIPNKRRRLQVAPTRRKLFDAAAKAEFLEWFAATCNCSLSARKTGFHYRTVIRHWREDPGFGADCEAALRMAYPRLEELALRAAEEALKPKRRRRIAGDRAPPAEHFRMDPATALQLLREHQRHAAGLAGGSGPGGSGPGGKPGRAPQAASGEEVLDALVKRLKAFGVRIGEAGEEKAGEDKAGEDGADGGAPGGADGARGGEAPGGGPDGGDRP